VRADTALAESGQKRGDRVNRSFAALHRGAVHTWHKPDLARCPLFHSS